MRRPALGIGLVVVLTAPAWVWNPYHLHTLIMAGIFAVLALSLNLLLGYTGQLSLGHAAFFGIGAYASALLTVKLEWSPWLGLLAAIALPGAGGLRHRPARAQAARRLLRAADHLLRGLRLAGERELDGPDQRAARHPGRAAGGDRAARAARVVAAHARARTTTWCWPRSWRPICSAWPSSARGWAARWWRCGRTRRSRPRWGSTRPTISSWPRWRAPRWPASRAASTRTTRASSARRSSCSPTRSRW